MKADRRQNDEALNIGARRVAGGVLREDQLRAEREVMGQSGVSIRADQSTPFAKSSNRLNIHVEPAFGEVLTRRPTLVVTVNTLKNRKILR